MKKILSLMLVILLFLTAGCKKAPAQKETGALLPPEVLGEQTGSVDETQNQSEADVPSQELSEEKTSTDSAEHEKRDSIPSEEMVFFKNGQYQYRAGSPISFEGLKSDFGTHRSLCYMPYGYFGDMQKSFLLDRDIVFRGKKTGTSVPVEILDSCTGQYNPVYCETGLQVLEVFYGDVQVGDIVTCKENIRVLGKAPNLQLELPVGIIPLVEDQEYIFILSKDQNKTHAGKRMYEIPNLNYTYHKLSDLETYKTAIQNDGARPDSLQYFGYQVLNYCLNSPDTALNLREEALKYVENIPEDATEEEILQALPEDKKELFDRMIKQYGTK